MRIADFRFRNAECGLGIADFGMKNEEIARDVGFSQRRDRKGAGTITDVGPPRADLRCAPRFRSATRGSPLRVEIAESGIQSVFRRSAYRLAATHRGARA